MDHAGNSSQAVTAPDSTSPGEPLSAMRLRSLLRAAPIGIGMVSNRVLVEVSDEICRMTGYAREELIGRSARILYPDEQEFERVGREKYDQIARRGTGSVEARWRRKDGGTLTVQLSSSPVNPENWAEGVTFTALDITSRKAMEEEQARLQAQLQQSSKMEAIGRLAGGVAHDFNNLLTSILGNVELVLLDLDPNEPSAAMLTEVNRAAQSAASLTRQLLAFSRKQIIEPRVLDLNALVGGLRQMLVRLLGENISLETSLAPALGSVRVDPGQFEQVIVNLAINARDAMPGGGRLAIQTADTGRTADLAALRVQPPVGASVMLAVSDNGQGMPPEVLGHLFEPFFTTKSKDRGTGLGLATIYGVVRQAGGTIDVQSEVGRGTTFRVFLPRVDEAAETGVDRAGAAELPRGRGTVLLAEDEESVRELAVRILQRLGYDLLVAGSGAEALAIAERHEEPIDLLLTDVVMPGMSGRELAAHLAALHAETAVLYTSGYTEEVIAHHGVLDSGLRFIAKPYTPQSLANAVQSAIGPKRSAS
jgi:two-component system, cell cycle sensor histidine kinase and response regulator CckA